MKKIAILLLLIFLPIIANAQNTQKRAIYFYSETCPHCLRVEKYFEDNGIFDKYDIQKKSVSNSENLAQLNSFFDAFGVAPEKRGYPVIFFDNQMLIGDSGDQSIIDNFVSDIEKADASIFPTPESIKQNLKQAVPAETQQAVEVTVPFWLLASAALADAFNPCALAVLILLLATVMAAGGKKRALISGLAFSFAVFSSYFMMGLGIYKAISSFSLPHYFSMVVAVVAILIGLANLKDVIWYGKVFIMEVPRTWRPKMQDILKKVTGPIGALGAGYLVSLFLVPCASGPYIVLLGKLAEKVDTAKTIPLLIVYNLIFVLPMIIITLAMYFGSTRMGKVEQWRQKNLRTLHAITAGLMLFIGGYLLYSLR
jgi:cytochrome c biogenesis protein CcdA/glutaredoxin